MSKELTPLEALKEIENFIVLITNDRGIRHDVCPDTRIWVKRNFNLDIIEPALKHYEYLKKENKIQDEIIERKNKTIVSNVKYRAILEEIIERYEKKLKALEIIKEKNVCVKDLINAKTLNIYNYNRDWWEMLVQQEFDLLKEVLK